MLTFNLKKEWFEKIKSGEKTHEYREFKYYWFVRIKNYFKFTDEDLFDMRSGDIFYERYEPIAFRCGYKGEILEAKVLSIKVVDGENTDLKTNGYVFDIEFELKRSEAENDR